MDKAKLYQWLAHFSAGGAQHVLGADRAEAIRVAEARARRRGIELVDLTGPDEEVEERGNGD